MLPVLLKIGQVGVDKCSVESFRYQSITLLVALCLSVALVTQSNMCTKYRIFLYMSLCQKQVGGIQQRP